jgi:hypothetical protein
MNRSAFAPALTVLICSAVVSSAFGQAKPAAPTTTPAPAAKAGFVTPLKGEAAIQVLPGTSKYDPKAKEVITTYKLKNMSSAPIALLKLDEYWYKDGKMVSTDTQNPAGWRKNVTFSHANGKVSPKAVKTLK